MYYTDKKIPKRGKGYRKISIPDAELLKVQRKALKEISRNIRKGLYNVGLEDNIHGFIPHKNACTAAKQHIGYDCTVIMDIENFFDNCTKETIIKIAPWLQKHRYFVNMFHDDGYLAQGFATSPILSTVVIAPVIHKLKRDLKPLLIDFAITVYADDIQISFNKGNDEGYNKENSVVQLVKSAVTEVGLSIKESKTRIRYAKYGYRKILGINVGKDCITASRKTNKKIRAAIHQKNNSSLGGLRTWAACLEPKPPEIEL